MHLKTKLQKITKDHIAFENVNLGDKIQVRLKVNNKKIDSGYVMSGDKSNTTIGQMEEALLLTYCRNRNINI